MELMWSKREETSADATEAAIPSSKDGRICLKEHVRLCVRLFYHTSLISLTGVLSGLMRRVRMVGVGTPTILTHKN